MGKIKVLHTKNRLSTDGSTTFLLNIVNQLRQDVQFDILLYTEKGNDWAYKFEELGCKIYYREAKSSNPILNKIERIKLYYNFLHEHKYDIVHVDTDTVERVDVVFCAWLCGVKKRFYHSHSTLHAGRGRLLKIPFYRHFLQLLVAMFSTDLLACSMDAANWMFPSHYIPRVKFIKNGICIDNFKYNSYNRDKIRDEYQLHGCFVIGCVARFADQKNHDFLIDIFNEVSKAEPRARLLLIGEGILKNDILKKANDLKLDKKVIFVGTTDNVGQYLSAMDLFILPSKNEGLGIAFIEAQANGLFCLASNMVPKEAKVSERMEFIDLNASAKYWAQRALLSERSEDNINRMDAWKDVEKAGYSIKKTAQTLLRLYTKR